MCHLQKATQETSRAVDGPNSKSKSSSRVPSLLQHCHGYVWTIAYQVESENSQRSANCYLHVHDDKSDSPGTSHRQNISAFLMAFRRFACLRGHPNICWSDCCKNFVEAQAYLKEIMQSWEMPKIQSVLSEEFTCDFKWQWNIPHASHQNGVAETLIKSVRQALNSTCKNQAFTEEQWRTFLAETTYMINGRPLYPSSDNIWECPPITPNDILMRQHNPPPQPEPEERINPRHLLRSTQNRVGEFWTYWMKYFAPNLLPRNKWFRVKENVEVGDLVLELDPNRKRSQWKMALITETYPGNDGLVRKVRMKAHNAEYDRPRQDKN